MTAYLHIL